MRRLTGALPVVAVVTLVAAAALDVTGRLGAIGPVRLTVYQALAAIVVAFAVWALVTGRAASDRTPLHVPVLAFLALATLSLAFAASLPLALVKLASLLSSAVLAWIVTVFLRDERGISMAVAWTLGIATLLGALAVLEWAGIFAVQPAIDFGKAYAVRSRVTFGDPNMLGSFLMAAALLAAPLLLVKGVPRRIRVAGWLAEAVAVTGVLTTFSRGALGGLLAGLVIVGALAPVSRRVKTGFAGAVVGVMLVVGLVVFDAAWIEENILRAGQSTSVPDRVYMIESSVDMWRDHPFGLGIGNFPIAYPAYQHPNAVVGLVESHVAYLTVLVETGTQGLAAFLWLIIALFFAAVVPVVRHAGDPRLRALAAGVAAASAGLLLQAFTYSTEASKLVWLAVGLGGAVWLVARDVRARRDPGRPPVVCHVTSVNIPADGRILYHQCRSLARRWRTVLVCRDDMPARTLEGVEIMPIPKSGGRVARWLAIPRLVRLARSLDADVYHFHNIELMPAMAGLAWRTGVPVIYDAHEHHPDAMATKTYIPGVARGLVAAAVELTERMLTRRFAAVVTADAALTGRYAPWAKRVVRLDNFPPLDLFPPRTGARPERPTLLYVGSISEVRGYDDMLETLRLVRAEVTEARLVLVGTPTDEVERRLAALDDPAVEVRGPVPYGEIAPVMASATVGLSLLRDIPKFQKNVPTKVFDYMAASLPYVATALGPVRELTHDGVGGRLVPPGDPAAAASAVLELLRDDALAERVAREGRRLIEREISWAPLEETLLKLYQDLIAETRAMGNPL